jgi:hypothetical protein
MCDEKTYGGWQGVEGREGKAGLLTHMKYQNIYLFTMRALSCIFVERTCDYILISIEVSLA